MNPLLFLGFAFPIFMTKGSLSIRLPDVTPTIVSDQQNQPLKVAAFALGSFWRSEAVFGCLPGVVRTTAGYTGGSKTNPEFRSLGDHAESVLIEYNPKFIQFRQLLDVFWASHDSRQVFGQGPDVGYQYRSIIFTNGTEEARMAAVSKEREQTKSKSSIVTTQIQQLGTFYPAESDHQFQKNVKILQFDSGGEFVSHDFVMGTSWTRDHSEFTSADVAPGKIVCYGWMTCIWERSR